MDGHHSLSHKSPPGVSLLMFFLPAVLVLERAAAARAPKTVADDSPTPKTVNMSSGENSLWFSPEDWFR